MTSKARLIELLATHSAQRGDFTLTSGRKSDLYIDARLTTMSPEGLTTIGTLGFEELQRSGWRVTAVGGLTLGADPVSYAISYASAGSKSPLRAFTVRKQPKAHGTQKLIEGPLRPGDRVAVIEDVITTGGSALQAIQALQSFGAIVTGILALIDREEGGRAALEQAGFSVIALTTASQIAALMNKQ
ncbi:MAG: orotate phosphoribosyltransferase, partial [Nitrospiraceae bacterium]|nr:orotate phosphoribosyltransferase [Nitrospiraceae bacterium]